jgi:uncharacterized coiled-coil DUF342 family protein
MAQGADASQARAKASEAVSASEEYARESKDEIVNKMEVSMATVQKTIDDLKKRADGATGEAQARLRARVAQLEGKRDELNNRLSEFQKSSGNAWKRMRAGLDSAWQETSKAFREARTEFASKKGARE